MSRIVLCACLSSLLAVWMPSSAAEVAHSETVEQSTTCTIDGRLNESAWVEAPNAQDWFKLSDPRGAIADYSPRLYFARDNHSLYIGIQCSRPAVPIQNVFATQRDEESWRDESVELFIQTEQQKRHYCHFVINTRGVVMDQIDQNPPEQWSHPRMKAAAQVADDLTSFTVEIALPWAGWTYPPREGAKWGFNVLRTININQSGLRDIATLSRLDSSAHEPSRFSTLIFRGNAVRLDRRGMIEGKEYSPIVNPSFERNLNDWTVHTWANGRYGPGTYTVEASDDAIDGLTSLCLRGENTGIRGAAEPSRAGVMSQPIDIPPGLYSLCGYYRTEFSDTELGQIRPSLAEVYFYGPDEMSHMFEPSAQWRKFCVTYEKRSPGAESILLRLWTDGAIWFDAFEIIQIAQADQQSLPKAGLIEVNGRSFQIMNPPVDRLLFEPSDRHRQVGLLPFSRRELWNFVHPGTAPRNGELLDDISIQAARGEFESALVGVYAMEDIKKFHIRFESDESTAQSVPGEWMQLARIPYWLQRTGYSSKEVRPIAEVIRPVDGLSHEQSLEAQRNVWFYLTAKIPTDAESGVYQGQIVLVGSNDKRHTLPVTLTVYPFELAKQDRHFGVYVEYYQDFEKEFAFMRRYGLDSAVLFSLIELQHKDERWLINPEPILTPTRHFVEAGMAAPFVIGMGGMSTHLAHRLGIREQISSDFIADAGAAIAPATEEEYPQVLREAYGTAVADLWEQLKSAQLADKVALYPVDEPTANVHRMPMARVEMRTIKQAASDAKIFCTVHDVPERLEQLAQWIDIACVAGQNYSPQLYQISSRTGMELWGYNGPAEQWDAQRGDGLGSVAADIKRMIYWIGHRQGANADQPLNDMIDPFKQVAMFYPSDSGYMSTVQYEALREGIDDLRYLATAESLLRQAEDGTLTISSDTVKRARSRFDAVRQRITTQLNWADCERVRRELADIITILMPHE